MSLVGPNFRFCARKGLAGENFDWEGKGFCEKGGPGGRSGRAWSRGGGRRGILEALGCPGPSFPAFPPDLGTPLGLSRQHLSYLQEIGSGWFGKVILGEIFSDFSPAQVVVKELRVSAGPLEQRKFLSEAQPYRSLHHPNVLQCLGLCAETLPFLLIMEFCQLGDLKRYLRAQRPPEGLSPEKIITTPEAGSREGAPVLGIHGTFMVVGKGENLEEEEEEGEESSLGEGSSSGGRRSRRGPLPCPLCSHQGPCSCLPLQRGEMVSGWGGHPALGCPNPPEDDSSLRAERGSLTDLPLPPPSSAPPEFLDPLMGAAAPQYPGRGPPPAPPPLPPPPPPALPPPPARAPPDPAESPDAPSGLGSPGSGLSSPGPKPGDSGYETETPFSPEGAFPGGGAAEEEGVPRPRAPPEPPDPGAPRPPPDPGPLPGFLVQVSTEQLLLSLREDVTRNVLGERAAPKAGRTPQGPQTVGQAAPGNREKVLGPPGRAAPGNRERVAENGEPASPPSGEKAESGGPRPPGSQEKLLENGAQTPPESRATLVQNGGRTPPGSRETPVQNGGQTLPASRETPVENGEQTPPGSSEKAPENGDLRSPGRREKASENGGQRPPGSGKKTPEGGDPAPGIQEERVLGNGERCLQNGEQQVPGSRENTPSLGSPARSPGSGEPVPRSGGQARGIGRRAPPEPGVGPQWVKLWGKEGPDAGTRRRGGAPPGETGWERERGPHQGRKGPEMPRLFLDLGPTGSSSRRERDWGRLPTALRALRDAQNLPPCPPVEFRERSLPWKVSLFTNLPPGYSGAGKDRKSPVAFLAPLRLPPCPGPCAPWEAGDAGVLGAESGGPGALGLLEDGEDEEEEEDDGAAVGEGEEAAARGPGRGRAAPVPIVVSSADGDRSRPLRGLLKSPRGADEAEESLELERKRKMVSFHGDDRHLRQVRDLDSNPPCRVLPPVPPRVPPGPLAQPGVCVAPPSPGDCLGQGADLGLGKTGRGGLFLPARGLPAPPSLTRPRGCSRRPRPTAEVRSPEPEFRAPAPRPPHPPALEMGSPTAASEAVSRWGRILPPARPPHLFSRLLPALETPGAPARPPDAVCPAGTLRSALGSRRLVGKGGWEMGRGHEHGDGRSRTGGWGGAVGWRRAWSGSGAREVSVEMGRVRGEQEGGQGQGDWGGREGRGTKEGRLRD
ncbi:serine/threonine-protein kinase LMTK3 [Sarcophilus harrisii]|uniref:serine/threonine-protein kinase LMTK3 n=1 Tax=Sarcophilus harrisii TaxID=9305 RepID=UPI0013020477|nr:serine/threonine-protein kinase LMTK3 [Sarcophilus harrisii]